MARKNELTVPAVPVRMYPDEEACGAWIQYLEDQLSKARRISREIVGEKCSRNQSSGHIRKQRTTGQGEHSMIYQA